MTPPTQDRWRERQQQRSFRLLCQLVAASPLILAMVRMGRLHTPGWIALLIVPPSTLAVWWGVQRGWFRRSTAAASLLIAMTLLATASHAFLPLARHILSVTSVLLVFASLMLSPRGFVGFAVFQLVLVLFARPLRVLQGLPTPLSGPFFLDLGLANVGLSAALWALDRQFRQSLDHLRVGIERARTARAAAVVASSAKLSFLAQMSHELRTPLNAILGYAEMLAEDRADAARVDLERIQAAGRELLERIGQVLQTAASAGSAAEASEPGRLPEETISMRQRVPVGSAMFAVACIISFAPTGFDTAAYGVLAMTLAAAIYPRRAFRREVVPWMFAGLGAASVVRVERHLSTITDATIPMVAMAAMAIPLALAVEQRSAARDRLALERLRAQRSEERARRLDDARMRFLRDTSVDIRTPLATIIGYAELLSDELDDPEVLGDLGRIERAAAHLQTIVGDVIDVTPEDAPVSLEPIAMVPCCERAIDLSRPTIEANGNELCVRLSDCHAIGDRRLNVQILVNLLGNAGKFTRDGRVEIELQTRQEHVVVAVRDTGEGIPDDQLDRVFEPFERLTSDPSVVGAGLGLALARQMARSQGGELKVQSELGQGSTFELTLLASPGPARDH